MPSVEAPNYDDPNLHTAFKQAVIDLLTDQDLTPDAETISMSNQGHSITALAHSPEGGAYIQVHSAHELTGRIGIHNTVRDYDGLYNGLLLGQEGFWNMSGAKPFDGSVVRVTIINSPERLNSFSNEPGLSEVIGAGPLSVVASQSGITPVGQVIAGWANGEIRTSDHTEWDVAVHDMQTHGKTWPLIPKPFRDRAIDRAKALTARNYLATELNAQPYERPRELKEFGNGAEGYSNKIRKLLEAIFESGGRQFPVLSVENQISSGSPDSIVSLRQLGIIPDQLCRAEARSVAAAALRETASHIASVLIAVEETHPDPVISARASDRRLKAWRTVQKELKQTKI